jgi:hypothetical protein
LIEVAKVNNPFFISVFQQQKQQQCITETTQKKEKTKINCEVISAAGLI